MEKILNTAIQFLSSPAMTVVVGAIVAFIIIRYIYRKIFKRNSVRLVVSVITICIIIFAIVLFILKYFEGIGQVYIEDDMNYVYGKVENVDPAKMEISISVVRSNMQKGGTGKVYGKLMSTAKIMYNNKAIEDKITLKDIKKDDFVYLVTNDEEIKNKEITVKAVLKPAQTSIFSFFFNERTPLTTNNSI